jgi:prepilin-type processing-associated H-X9-DG protein
MVLFVGVVLCSCSSFTSPVVGKFWFKSNLPAGPSAHIPVSYMPLGELTIDPGGTWSVGWMMMDFEWKGDWTRLGNRLTLMVKEPDGFGRPGVPFLELEVIDKDRLKAVGGDFSKGLQVKELERAPVIPKYMQDAAKRDEALENARSLFMSIDTFQRIEGHAPTKAEIKHWRMVDPDVKGFIYTFKGNKLPKGKKAATTEIGRFSAPSGVAIAFADGHAEWRAKP